MKSMSLTKCMEVINLPEITEKCFKKISPRVVSQKFLEGI